MLSCFGHLQLLATLRTAVHQASLSMEFSKQKYWSGLPFSIPGHLPNPGLEPMSLMSPALAGGFFTTNTTWCFKPVIHHPSNSDSSVQSLSHVWLFATPWTATWQASLSITNSRSLLKLMFIELMMPYGHMGNGMPNEQWDMNHRLSLGQCEGHSSLENNVGETTPATTLPYLMILGKSSHCSKISLF